MACFLVPVTEAIVSTIATKVVKSHEDKCELANSHAYDGKVKFSKKLKWLNSLLWGGSGLLAFEHVWHGEVVPYYPFLTAMHSPQDTANMLHEVSTVGVTMALLVTAVWCGMLAVSKAMEHKSKDTNTQTQGV